MIKLELSGWAIVVFGFVLALWLVLWFGGNPDQAMEAIGRFF